MHRDCTFVEDTRLFALLTQLELQNMLGLERCFFEPVGESTEADGLLVDVVVHLDLDSLHFSRLVTQRWCDSFLLRPSGIINQARLGVGKWARSCAIFLKLC